MENISIVNIWYPSYSDPNARAWHEIGKMIRGMFYYAKKFKVRCLHDDWEMMWSRYDELKGACKMLESLGVISTTDQFRIPFIAYKVALKYAGTR